MLEWMSEKGAGTWGDFRAAWEWLGNARTFENPAEKAWIAARDLSALAHIEVAWDGIDQWAAAPPVLTMLPHSGGRALLTGARTRALYRFPSAEGEPGTGLLEEQAEELGLWIDPIPRRNAPSTVLVACNEPDDAEQLAVACGIAYSYSVCEQLAAMLPPLGAALRLGVPGPLPEGFPVDRFNDQTLQWDEIGDGAVDAPGLYRAKTWAANVHVLRTPLGDTLRVERDYAIYEILRWEEQHVLTYFRGSRELWVPSGARLPLLHERAAVLCSGQLPKFATRPEPGVTYVNVSPRVAQRIADSLAQRLEVSDA